jgi:hypothetical protein
MLFLMRLAFWLLVIVLLLPSSEEDNKRLIASAERTVDDLRGFCGRNPDVCESARTATSALLQKVQNGVEMLETWMNQAGEAEADKNADRLAPPTQTIQPPGLNPAAPLTVRPRWQDTLSEADREMEWRGPGSS